MQSSRSTNAPDLLPREVTHSPIDGFLISTRSLALPDDTGMNWNFCAAPALQAASRMSQLDDTVSVQAPSLSATSVLTEVVIFEPTAATASSVRWPCASASSSGAVSVSLPPQAASKTALEQHARPNLNALSALAASVDRAGDFAFAGYFLFISVSLLTACPTDTLKQRGSTPHERFACKCARGKQS